MKDNNCYDLDGTDKKWESHPKSLAALVSPSTSTESSRCPGPVVIGPFSRPPGFPQLHKQLSQAAHSVLQVWGADPGYVNRCSQRGMAPAAGWFFWSDLDDHHRVLRAGRL